MSPFAFYQPRKWGYCFS